MPASGAVVVSPRCGAVFSCNPEQAVSTPNTAVPAIASANHLRPNLHETRFMIITLPSAVKDDNDAAKGPCVSEMRSCSLGRTDEGSR
jgi:hypothetical protein